MKKILVIILAVTMLFTFGDLALAKGKIGHAHAVTGEITAVDTQANTFTLKTDKGDITCALGADSKIKSGKEVKTLADVKVGDKVTCKYKTEGDKHVCKTLNITSAK